MKLAFRFAAALAFLATSASAQVFVQLPGVELRGLSGDGTVAVGRVGGFDFGYHYDFSSGTLTQIVDPFDLQDVSRDGSLLCGSRLLSSGPEQRATLWAIDQPTSLPIAGGGCGITPFLTDLSAAFRLDGAGTLAVGRDCQDAVAWSLPGNVRTALPSLPGTSVALCVSRDGRTIGGLHLDPQQPSVSNAMLWSWNQTTSAWDPPTIIDPLGSVQLLSATGTTAVVRPAQNTTQKLRLWRAGVGLSDLPPLPWLTSSDPPEPTGITWDARMVVGAADGGGFVWTQAGGMQRAREFLENAGVTIPVGWPALQVRGVSDDGRVLWGHSDNSSYESWIALVRPWYTYGDLSSPAQRLSLDGLGSTGLGDQFTLRTTGIPSAAPGSLRLVSRAPVSVPAIGGRLFVDPFPGGSMPLVLDPAVGGISDGVLTIPNDPTLLERTFYAQTFAADPAQPAGWLLSNGLRFTLGS